MGSTPIDPNDLETLQRQIAELQSRLAAAQQAEVGSSGAVGQGDALGERNANMDGDNSGTLNTGTQTITTQGGAAVQGSVPLDTTLHIPKDATLAQWLSRERDRQRDDFHAQREVRPVSALEAVSEHRQSTVLGKPGSGKSTFGASVLLTLAQAWQGHVDELAKLGESWTHGVPLPIRVVLRRFAERLPPGEKPARAGDVWAFIARDLQESGYGLSAEAMKYVQRIARNDGALILLDGLDECGSSASRERVLGAVHELMRSAGPKCRFVLTARPYAWPSGPDPARGVYALADLTDTQIEQFIRAWYAALVQRQWRSPGDAERKVGDLLAARHRPDLLPLATNRCCSR